MTAAHAVEIDEAESPRVRDAVAQLENLLVVGETLESWAVQRRLFALIQRRVLVGATSGRLVVMSRELLSGFRIYDVRWQDLKDVKLTVGIFGADLAVVALGSTDLASGGQTAAPVILKGLRKDQAQAVYRACQTHEQAWREKRRIRELEELRAKSGGVHIGAGRNPGNPSMPSAETDDPVARLERAREMLAKGLISDAEYEAIKARVVSGL